MMNWNNLAIQPWPSADLPFHKQPVEEALFILRTHPPEPKFKSGGNHVAPERQNI